MRLVDKDVRDRVGNALALCAAILTCWNCASVNGAELSVCRKPEADKDQARILSPPLGEVVVGKGRLQFYSAPNTNCRINGVFVVPGDSLVAYAETDDGWTSVMYMSSGQQGWVRSSRLQTTGTMGLSQ